MKKLKSLLVIVVLLALASCQKEVIVPADAVSHERPAFQNDQDQSLGDPTRGGSTNSGSQDKGLIVLPDGTIVVDNGNGNGKSGESGITDPNKDPDANKQRGSRGKK